MALKNLVLTLRILGGSLVVLLLAAVLLRQGRNVSSGLLLLATLGFVGAAGWLALVFQRAVTENRMASFQVRYHLGPQETVPAEFARLLDSLAQVHGHIVVTLLSHTPPGRGTGSVRLFLEAPESAQQAIFDLLAKNLPGAETRLTNRPLIDTMRKMRAYFAVAPQQPGTRRGFWPLRKPSPPPNDTRGAPPSPCGPLVVEAFLRAGDGELRWHIFPGGRGLIIVALLNAAAGREMLQSLPALVRRFPRPVWPLPASGTGWVTTVVRAVRKAYWWSPVWAEGWPEGIAAEVALPATVDRPQLDTGEVRLALPATYRQSPPVLVLGHSGDPAQPVGLSMTQGPTTHLLIGGGGAAGEECGVAVVEQALGLGMGVVALGDYFDGTGGVYNSLPAAKREQVLRISPLLQPSPRVGLLTPQGGQPGAVGEAVAWLTRFLEAEGISASAQEGAVQLCQVVAAAGLAQAPTFDLLDMVGMLEQPAAARALLQQAVLQSAEWPEDLAEKLREELDRGEDDFRFRSYAALITQRLPVLRERWTQAVTRPAYINLGTVLREGGALFCSLPLRTEQAHGGSASAQLARYVVLATLHALAWRGRSGSRPVLLYLGDYPFYAAPLALDWAGLLAQGCMVVLQAATLGKADLAPLPLQQTGGPFAVQVLRLDAAVQPPLAQALGVPVEALSRLQGRTAVLRHPVDLDVVTCTVTALATSPEGVEAYFPRLPEATVAAEPAGEKTTLPAAPAAEPDEPVGEPAPPESDDEDKSILDDLLCEEAAASGINVAALFGLSAEEPALEDEGEAEEEAAGPSLSLGASAAELDEHPPAGDDGGNARLTFAQRRARVQALLQQEQILTYEELGLPPLPEGKEGA